MILKNDIPIDATKLRAALAKRGISEEKASHDIGFSESYVSQLCHRGRINLLAQAQFEEYGIDYSEYKPECSNVIEININHNIVNNYEISDADITINC